MIDTTYWISQLPEFIIHHILSFLESPADLVRSSVLSKQWFDLTASFPILDFNEETFETDISKPGIHFDEDYAKVLFLKYVAYTTSRFCDQDVSAHMFDISMSVEEPIHLDIIDRCVGLILKKGVKVFNINVFRLYSPQELPLSYFLPNILFSASSLTSLKISKCRMPSSLVVDVVMFKSLKQLCLWNVIVDEDMIKRLIAGCPLLEEFDVNYCSGFKRFCIYGHQNLQELKIYYYDRTLEIIDVEAPNVCHLRLQDWAGIGAPAMNLTSCKKLKTLSYDSCHYDSTLPRLEVCTRFLSNFPFLEILFLGLPSHCNNLKLSSNSVRTLVLNSRCDLQNIELNIPNFLFFKCSDKSFYPEPLEENSADSNAGMECYLSVEVYSFWFQNLKQFLEKNGFKVLKLHISKDDIDVNQLKLIQSTPYELEHVELQFETIDQLSVYAYVMDALLLCCRTRSLTLTLNYCSISLEKQSLIVKFAYVRLLKREDQGQTNISFLVSFYSIGEKHFNDLNSLLTALPRDRIQSITFLKEEVFQKKDNSVMQRDYMINRLKESTSNDGSVIRNASASKD